MKNVKQLMLFACLMLLTYAFCYGQQTVPGAQQRQRAPEDSTIKMSHFQTEIWDPEIPYVQPGVTFADPPSDAIILLIKNGKKLPVLV